MGKYDPLRRFLARQKQTSVELSFAEIERIIGAMLPRSAEAAQWWADQAAPHMPNVQAASWRTAGFSAALVGEERVRFDRTPRNTV